MSQKSGRKKRNKKEVEMVRLGFGSHYFFFFDSFFAVTQLSSS
jgi:hypothetical protein